MRRAFAAIFLFSKIVVNPRLRGPAQSGGEIRQERRAAQVRSVPLEYLFVVDYIDFRPVSAETHGDENQALLKKIQGRDYYLLS